MTSHIVRKAVIPVAGVGTRMYPASSAVQKELFPLVDRDGLPKPVIQIIVEEAVESGIEDICLVVSPGGEEPYRRYFRSLSDEMRPKFEGKLQAIEHSEHLADLGKRISFAVQETPEGYGHAVYCAGDFVGDEPFLLLLGDHVYISHTEKRCARQLMDVSERHGCSVSAVNRAPAGALASFGTIAGDRIEAGPNVYEIARMIEKPSVEVADRELRVEGIPPGTYLCLFGMHVHTPRIFDVLEEHIRNGVRMRGEIQMTTAQGVLAERERYLALEVEGDRYDMGVPVGLIETQVALALQSPARENVLRQAGDSQARS